MKNNSNIAIKIEKVTKVFKVYMDKANTLKEKGYTFNDSNDSNTKQYGSISLYTNNLKDTDKIVLWQYKGIYVLTATEEKNAMNLNFDKFNHVVPHHFV